MGAFFLGHPVAFHLKIFIPCANFVGVLAVLNMGAFFLGHPVY